ncbi:sulfurtransferase [Acinetobacter larvae]
MKALNLDFKIEVEQLAACLGHPQLRILDLSRASVFAQLHIPHAMHVAPARLLAQGDDATGLLPDPAQMEKFIADYDLTTDCHVVAYDDEGGAWAGRLLWNLNCLGFANCSWLNGGIHAWLAAAYPVANGVVTVMPSGQPLIHPQYPALPQYRIQYDELKAQVVQGGLQLWDCRSWDEYIGQRLAARKGGHIPGAYHFEWSTALNRENHLKLRPLKDIQHGLEQSGLDLSRAAVTYCQSHHRSGLAYIIARLLAWELRVYDGAWSEWGNRPDSPIVSGEQPF